MFDFAWSEIALIGVVALIAIGPKDMPVAIKAVTDVIKKARRMAAEFQTHVDELVRDSSLHEVREQIDEIRRFDLRGEIERAVDSDGSLRSTFASNPLEPMPAPPAVPEAAVAAAATEGGETAVIEAPAEAATTGAVEPAGTSAAEPATTVAAEPVYEAPAFIPPEIARPEEPPAFIPPGIRRR
ncbi:MAG: twin-arginine translocase subunit TatB [Acidisphaera sp.]|nr:twin-arginine translocase subunit TatB [Acidisphaera sp.]